MQVAPSCAPLLHVKPTTTRLKRVLTRNKQGCPVGGRREGHVGSSEGSVVGCGSTPFAIVHVEAMWQSGDVPMFVYATVSRKKVTSS